MSAQWDHWTHLVERGETRNSTKRNPHRDWIIRLGNGEQWDGWNEIVVKLSGYGYEIINVVAIQGGSMNGCGGGTQEIQIFCKRPKNT